MKLLLSLALLFLNSFSFGQTTVQIKWTTESDMPAQTTVYYDAQRPLDWPDFQGTPEESGNTAALTTSGFGYRMNMGYTGTKGMLKIYVYCYFDKTKSWVKKDKMNNYVLSHEQKHFDISYLAAARFMQSLKKISFSRENVGSKLQEAYDASSNWMKDQQHAYDSQTRNGISHAEQENWINRINRQLKAVKD